MLWDKDYLGVSDGEEWNGQARHGNLAYELLENPLVETSPKVAF